ncbi:auxin response factor [Musa troglodytarum]|uniref:Auxin response factor n=1 Tax=Musa troglodytarum TaxID=320322 RepID=A0A9E7IEX7_9LILI|nr:auxin response factor [Musa troglodytarum]
MPTLGAGFPCRGSAPSRSFLLSFWGTRSRRKLSLSTTYTGSPGHSGTSTAGPRGATS